MPGGACRRAPRRRAAPAPLARVETEQPFREAPGGSCPDTVPDFHPGFPLVRAAASPSPSIHISRRCSFEHPRPETPLWAVRLVLLAAVIWHILAATQLWLLNRSARPVGYSRKENVPTSYAARTMIWSGPILAGFVVFHILHLTTGDVLPAEYQELHPYHNLTAGFSHPWVSAVYIVCMLMLCTHLYHGLWSMFQSVGISHPRYTPWLKRFAKAFAIFICVGTISIPISVMTGILPVK